jgi:hypothetical protein
MSGRRLINFREGDLSEYLAQYLLSRFSYVNPVPRQEDFGVADFLCVLGKKESGSFYPEYGYYIQVKSTEDDVIFDKNAAKWISLHMDLPLIICIIDKVNSHIKLYSCCRVWVGLFIITEPETLIIKLNEGTDSQIVQIDREHRTINVPVGLPILSMNISDIEDRRDVCYDILRPWLELDKKNIARRGVGRIFSSGFLNWEENRNPSVFFNQYTFGPDYRVAEKELKNILIALAHSYKEFGKQTELEALFNYLKHYKNYIGTEEMEFIKSTFGTVSSFLM